MRDSSDLVRDADLADLADKEVSERIFPAQVDQGARKPTTWAWMMSRIRDGNGIKPPRNLIDLIAKAKEAQIRSEDRNPRTYAPNLSIIEADPIRRALRALSDQRVQDTLLAEAADLAPTIDRFRDGKAEHNSASLAALLDVPESGVRNTIKLLLDMGFLEETGSSYKVPMLYRDGLAITQGKAFSSEPAVDDES